MLRERLLLKDQEETFNGTGCERQRENERNLGLPVMRSSYFLPWDENELI